jgi:hypothetical protein
MTVSVSVKKEADTIQLYEHSGKYTITLPVTSKFSAFTDIQYHESYDLGDMSMADVLFNNNIEKIPHDCKHFNMLKNHIINSEKEPFISLEPNCTLSFTKTSSENINIVTHVNTIAKMTGMKFSTEDVDRTVAVDLTFEILDGNMLIPVGTYEYCSITVDNFWDDFIDVISVTASVVGAGVTCAATAGIGCAAGVAGVAATVATVAT